ncbi:MAG: hypothetical protein LBK68_00610 [Candidatus Margulisbacteria bacterium]|jgi:hypothetical protein|nr:hypothetical protein [Candidatus Margulisiibacteriota bacterium]
MAGNYTDSFAGDPYYILKGEQLSAAGVNAALNTKEKVANKQVDSMDAAGTLTSSSSDSYYPTSKLVGKNLDTLSTTISTGLSGITTSLNGKQDKIGAGIAKNIVAYSGTAGTFDTLTRAATIMETSTASASDNKIPTEKAVATALAASISTLGLSGKEDASNKVTSIDAANKNDTAKYPTTGAVAALVSTELATIINLVLPKGTILAMESMSYYSSADAAFRAKWQVCDGTGITPDLRHKFLRGFLSGDIATGGADTQTVSVPLLKHNHTFTGTEATGYLPIGNAKTFESNLNGVFSPEAGGTWYLNKGDNSNGIKFSMTPEGSIDEVGTRGDDNISISTVPSYCTVIYIMKIA